MKIRQVHIKGNNRTHASVFETELQDAYEATSLEDISQELSTAAQKLSNIGIFDSINIELSKAPEPSSSSSSSKSVETGTNTNATDVTITVKEKNWWNVKLGATTDGAEGTAESTCHLINPLGQAERFGVTYAQGHVGSGKMNISYSQPHLLGLPWLLTANVSNETMAYERFSSYSEIFRGGFMGVQDPEGVHQFSIHCGWRDIIPRRNAKIPHAFAASRSIMYEANPSLKTSVKYTYTNDTRNDPVVPAIGGLMSWSTEVAGGLGDVEFVKGDAKYQTHASIGPVLFDRPLLTLSLSSNVGAIRNVGSDARRGSAARISDRYFLGGATNLRGFEIKGVGPRSDSAKDGGNLAGDALGGSVMYSALASVNFPLPIPLLALLGFRGQLFGTLGNLTIWDRLFDRERWMKNLVQDTRAAVGVGVVMGTNLGRLEANYSWVLQSLDQDRLQPAQFGISATFN